MIIVGSYDMSDDSDPESRSSAVFPRSYSARCTQKIDESSPDQH